MRFEQQLKIFLRILDAYPADTPLGKFLPGYFRQNKQMGSTDRKTASRLLYNYFRLGKACSGNPVEERLLIAEFLCSKEENLFLNHFKPELASKNNLTIAEKVTYLESTSDFRLKDVFPFHNHISAEIDKNKFLQSFFVQPDLFIRLYPQTRKLVLTKLDQEHIAYQEEGECTLRLPNGTRLENIFADEKKALYEVQDLSSQHTGEFFKPKKYDAWWDACAASGGKSLLLLQQQPEIKLLVSDKRASVLANLDERFTKAGIHKFQKKELDLTENLEPSLHHYEFDGILLDAPCTGSGTWNRTPEMISQFSESRIAFFQTLQRTIAGNVLKYLKPGKPLIYITCSVFQEENEQVIDYLVKEFDLQVESVQVIKGYDKKADTMFVARLINAD